MVEGGTLAMAVAGAVIVPKDFKLLPALSEKLRAIREIEIFQSGDGGIAILIKSEDLARLKELSALISGWEEVADLQFAWFK